MLQYGLMKLRRELTESEQEIMQGNLKDIIDIDEWWMAQGSYQCDEFWRIFEICEQITAKDIDLYQNERKQILQDLLPIRFPFLINLNLRENNIVSIEGISRLNAPQLQYLTISSNNISDMRVLRKTYFPNLVGLNLHQNKTADFSWLPEMACSQNMNYISLEFQDNDDPIIQQNFSILFKLRPKTFKKLLFDSETTIKNRKLFGLLGKRYPKIKLPPSLLNAD